MSFSSLRRGIPLILAVSVLLCSPVSAEYSVPDSGVRLLALAVAAECGDAPFAVQIALAAVMLHRLEDPRFGDTAAQVVYAADFLSCTRTGRISVPPDPAVYDKALSAVQYAIRGMDPTDGAFWFGGGSTGRTAPAGRFRFLCDSYLFW